MKRHMKKEQIDSYQKYLNEEEKSQGTIEKYLRDVEAFALWLKGREVSREHAIQWREELVEKGYAPVTVNSMLSALNGFLRFMGWEECRVKFLRIQRKMFREQSRNLTRKEYERLLGTARRWGREQTELLMETICSTGIRVSEIIYITVEAAKEGRTEIKLKGKIRTILLPGKLRKKLLKYTRKRGIRSGEIFVNGKGKSLSRQQIWQEMKKLCSDAGVASSKVFPHNLRHLFAVTFYHICKDIVRLADVLGHSCMETTRIYLLSTGTEHIQQLERMGLVR